MGQGLPIIINLFAALVGAGGQYLYKTGAARLNTTPFYLNWQILLGAILFTAVMALFILGFKLGGKLNVVYPMYATTFIWGSLMGVLLDKEPWSFMQLTGVSFVVLGLSLIAYFAPTS